MAELRKYGVATVIQFPLIDAGATDYEATPVTHATGDTQISKDQGAFANTSNAFAHEGNGIYSITLTATEMQAAKIVVTIIDSATKAWEDQSVIIDTYGNASAEHAFDLDTATQSCSLAAGAINNASLAENMEIVFETDFATNYNTTRNAWVTNVQDFVGTTASDPFGGNVVSASVTGAVGSVTGNVGGNVSGNVTGSVGSNLELGPTEVNQQVADVMKTDTAGEPSQGAPPVAASMEDKIGYLYTYMRNKKVTDTNTANQHQVFADNESTILWEYDLTNATNITTQAEAKTGA